MKLLLLPVCFRHYVIYIALPFVWQWQLFCIWLRLWTSETLSAPEPKSDARLTQNLFFGSPHASHLIYPPSGFGSGGHPGSHNTCPDILASECFLSAALRVHLTRTIDNVPTPTHCRGVIIRLLTWDLRSDRSMTSWPGRVFSYSVMCRVFSDA